MRVTTKDLNGCIDLLRRCTGGDFELDVAYGGYRLVCDGGSRDVSKRTTKRELYDSIHMTLNVLDQLEKCKGGKA